MSNGVQFTIIITQVGGALLAWFRPWHGSLSCPTAMTRRVLIAMVGRVAELVGPKLRLSKTGLRLCVVENCLAPNTLSLAIPAAACLAQSASSIAGKPAHLQILAGRAVLVVDVSRVLNRCCSLR